MPLRIFCLFKASSLEKKWLTGRQKMQEHQKKLEATWSLAREEAAKCKAAKVVIKNLAMKVGRKFLIDKYQSS